MIPNCSQLEQDSKFQEKVFGKLRELGVFGCTIPIEYGGSDCSLNYQCQTIKEISRASISLSLALESHYRVCSFISQYGSDVQKRKYLPLLSKGTIMACNAYQEKNGKTPETQQTIIQCHDKWTMNGYKEWVTGSREAGLIAVFSNIKNSSLIQRFGRSTAIILLQKGQQGIEIGEETKRMGIYGISLTPILLHHVEFKEEDILGNFEFEAVDIISQTNELMYLWTSASAIGVSERLMEQAYDFVKLRERNNIVGQLLQEPILKQKLGELQVKLYAAQALLEQAIKQKIEGGGKLQQIQSCKAFTTELAKEIALSVQTIFGAQGYTDDYDIQRQIGDILALPIVITPTNTLVSMVANLELKQSEERDSQSIVLQYHEKLSHLKHETVKKVSLGEKEITRAAGQYKGVDLILLDMTTFNPTHTFKDTLTCITFAHMVENNIHQFCAQSSGNTASSFIRYCQHTGIKMILFYPSRNSYKIDPQMVSKYVTVVEVDATEPELKATLAKFSKVSGIPIMPSIDLQYEANKLRAYFIEDQTQKKAIRFNYYAQGLSSAFGPLGLYQGYKDMIKQGLKPKIPKLLGVQQEAVCPYVKQLGEIPDGIDDSAEILEPTMFRTDPTPNLVNGIKEILDTFGGKVIALLNSEYKTYSNRAIQIISQSGINLSWVESDQGGKLLEQAGVFALSGVLQQIDKGYIKQGETVLVGITGGSRPTPKSKLIPHFKLQKVPDDEEIVELVEELKRFQSDRNQSEKIEKNSD